MFIILERNLTQHLFKFHDTFSCGPGSSVRTATDYGLNGLGIESRWDETFHHPDRPWGPPTLLYNGYRVSRGW